MRVFIASLGTETSTYAPFPTGLLAFEEYGLIKNGSTADGGTKSIILATWRRLAEACGDEVVESLCVFAQPAGRTVRAVYERLRDEILDDLRAAHAEAPIDIVLLCLHGAMVADGYDDCEGDMLRRAREIAPNAVIGTELDLHCHLTEAMLRQADLVIAVKEYPHIDGAERAVELFDLCRRTALGSIHPVAAMVDAHMVGFYPTFTEPMKSIVAGLREVEKQPGILSATIAHGFAWADVADAGTRVLVYADGDGAPATQHAKTLAQRMYAARHALQPDYPDIATSLDRASRLDGRVVLGDFSDNPGAASPGDSTFFLRAMLERGVTDAVIGGFWDPVVANLCTDAGVGARMRIRLGGKSGPSSGDPIDLDVEVMGLCEEHSQGVLGGRQRLGRSVWLHAQGIDILVCTVRSQVYDPDAFTGIGIALEGKRLLVVKSSTHYEAAFGPIADHLWPVSSPGAMTMDFASMPYTRRDLRYFPRVDDPWAVFGAPQALVVDHRERSVASEADAIACKEVG